MAEEEKLRSQILALENEIFELKKKRDSLTNDIKRWLSEEQKVKEKILECKRKIEEYRSQRDKINQEVKGLKDKIKTFKEEIFERIEKCKKLRNEISDFRKKVFTGKDTAKKVFEDLEWKIQVTHLTPTEEKALMEKIKFLEKELQIHSQIEVREEELRRESMEIESLKRQVDNLREKISGLVEESRKAHEKMVEFLRRRDELKGEIKGFRQKISLLKGEENSLHRRIVEASNRKRRLEERLREMVEEARIRKAIEASEKIVRSAEEKLGKGGKLTFEELRLLMSRRKIEFKP
ncbi:MAG: hypothetical protein DRO36_00125 [Candidatus Hecatellales archaeon]|nr:MAG: hypothetical protein DRO36_00125 [Candidatus Hecatellales archaeon]